jgi:hypothetical protein
VSCLCTYIQTCDIRIFSASQILFWKFIFPRKNRGKLRGKFVYFLFPQLPLDTGTKILHLSGIWWMFFLSFGPIVWQYVAGHCRQLRSVYFYAPITWLILFIYSTPIQPKVCLCTGVH